MLLFSRGVFFLFFFGTNPFARLSEFLPSDLNHFRITRVHLDRAFLMFSTSIWNTQTAGRKSHTHLLHLRIVPFLLKLSEEPCEKVFRALGFLSNPSKVLYSSLSGFFIIHCVYRETHTGKIIPQEAELILTCRDKRIFFSSSSSLTSCFISCLGKVEEN